VTRFVDHYNHYHLHSALGYITPAAALAGGADAIWAPRDQKLEAARANRRAAASVRSTERCATLATVH
jgi:hypothetical protein